MSPTQLLVPPFSASADTRSVAKIQIIDSGVRIGRIKPTTFLTPHYPGFDYLPTAPAWVYLIASPTGRKVLFDLGVPKNWRNLYPPGLVARIDTFGWDIQHEEKGVPESLEEAGVRLDEIEGVVWSHTHWDHTGDMTLFPPTVDLIVGPTFKEKKTPGYPTNPNGDLPESAWNGRNLCEISREQFETSGLRVGDLPAYDYFGDGSFYLVYTPGHTEEHLCALVRTTKDDEEDSFIFLGGDICHHGGALRPSRYLHLPNESEYESLSPGSVCPGDLLELNEKKGNTKDEPFFLPALGENLTQAAESIYKAQEADGKANVLFLWAHDAEPFKSAELSPKYANGWKRQGWKQKMLWSFLGDLKPNKAR